MLQLSKLIASYKFPVSLLFPCSIYLCSPLFILYYPIVSDCKILYLLVHWPLFFISLWNSFPFLYPLSTFQKLMALWVYSSAHALLDLSLSQDDFPLLCQPSAILNASPSQRPIYVWDISFKLNMSPK